MIEEWRPVVGWPEYEVSNLGRVRSVDQKVTDRRGRIYSFKGRSMRLTANKHGYLRLSLTRGSRSQTVSTHILVARSFIGPRPARMQVCHKDGDPTNNSIQNLRYGTFTENNRDTVRHGRHRGALKTHCPRKHLLQVPNLMPSGVRIGRRYCLSCSRAHAWCRGNPGFDLQAVSDRYYAEIVEAAA